MKNIRKSLIAGLAVVLFSLSFSFTQNINLSGSFVGADSIHQSAGSFELIEEEGQRIIRFSEDFVVTRGPDLFVWVVKGDNTEERVNLGRLQNRAGTQEYVLPDDANLEDFDRIIIWCRAFRVLFATAEFQLN